MKSLIRWRIALPFIILILVIAITLGIIAPLMTRSIIVKAAQTSSVPDYRAMIWVMISIVLVGIALAFVLSIYVTRNTIMPIKRLSLAASRMGEGKFEEIKNLNAPEEIMELSATLHQTANRLGEQISDLTRERATLSAVLSQMTDGVLIADQSGRVQLLNRAAERLFHIKEKNAIDRSVVEVMRHHQLVDLWSEVREGEPKTITLEMGTDHKFLQAIGISLGTDLPGSKMLLLQDLTMIRRMDIIRRDFISNVSHELRTPLASLKALTDTLLDGALEDPPAARRFVVRMDTEVDNLTLLVNELLELSRIESGKISFEFQRIPPLKLLSSPCERMSLQADRVGLKLDLNCPSDLPQVFADPDRIGQVVINLLHNAIKFTPSGGQITVSARQKDEFVIFSVRDTGVGIDQKDLNRIFERFYKADRARTGGGTGLGLSISRHMIEAHGGKIWVESQEGMGSTFHFSLPIA